MKLKCAGWLFGAALLILPVLSVYSQVPGAPVSLSPAAAEVVKLAESGTTDDVLQAYIQKTPTPYNLSADDVVYLKDVGLSSPVITAMLNHDKSLPQTYTYNQQAYPPTGQPPAQPADFQPPTQQPPPIDTGAEPAYVSDAPAEVNYFYNDLSPYGSWVMLDGYGWCWQPRAVIVNRGWRPYCDGGHWVYSDAGWFWASDYSWGWAPFHYGRWHMHPTCGWVWFPDTVWAPAWVVWRSSGDYCGWAPLPFRSTFDARFGFRFNGVSVGANFDFGLSANVFAFVALKDFNQRDVGHRRLRPEEVTRVYRNTTIINNYTVNNNHVIVNHGIPAERVAAATHTQIKTVTLHDLPAGANKPATKGGTGAVVYRHELKAPVRTTAPVVAQKIDDRHPVIQHTPVTPAKVERKITTGNVTPAASVRSTEHVQPSQPAQPGGEKFTPHTQTQNASTVHQPTVVTTPSHTEEAKPAYRTVEPSQPVTATHSSSTVNSTARQTSPAQTATTVPTPHVYYPKSYYQAASAHALPPEQGASSAGTHSTMPAGQPAGGPHGQSQGQPK